MIYCIVFVCLAALRWHIVNVFKLYIRNLFIFHCLSLSYSKASTLAYINSYDYKTRHI